MNGNDFVRIMLMSPLHVLMGNTLLITVTGRRTGRRITAPVNYYRDRDELWIISTRSRNWWRNVKGGAEVDLRLDGREMKGFADAILDESAVASHIQDYVRHVRMSARSLGVHVDHGVPNREDAAGAAKERLFVRICLRS